MPNRPTHVAVLLPAGKLFDLVWSQAVAPAAAEHSIPAARIGVDFSSENQLGALCNALEKADLILADLTGLNPHVMYLVGHAHGIGKSVLFIACRAEGLPFDPARHPVLIYAGETAVLKAELSAYFRGDSAAGRDVPQAERDRDGEAKADFLARFGDILAAHQHEHKGTVRMENRSTYILLDQDMDLALVQDLARRARELGVRLKLM